MTDLSYANKVIAALQEDSTWTPRSHFLTEFAFGDKVQIDGDHDLKGRVTGFCWTAPGTYTIEVTWLANGDVKTAWFSGWRLTRSP